MNWTELSKTIVTWLFVLVGIIFLTNHFSPSKKVIIDTKIEYKWDTVKVDSISYIPKPIPYPVPDIRWDTFKTPVDTNLILKDYFTKVFYSDSLIHDSITIAIQDTITRNRIFSRTLSYSILYPTKIITNEVLVVKNEYFYGAQIVSGREGFSFIGPEFTLKTKKNNLFQLGIGIDNNFLPTASLSASWKF